MGILNVTPDSFSDGGEFNNLEAALNQAQKLVANGADILDIGGQSTRPGAEIITVEEELKRVIPIIRELRPLVDVPISIDTLRAQVAQVAVNAGADLVNDISGATFDPQMLKVVAQLQVPIILMHSRGNPQTMQGLTEYNDLIGEIIAFLAERIDAAKKIGIKSTQIIIDPGLGFAKNFAQNLTIIRNLQQFTSLNCPILLGPSRKSFIGQILNKSEPKERVWGTSAACCAAIANKVDILRVHDVEQIKDVCNVADVIWRGLT